MSEEEIKDIWMNSGQEKTIKLDLSQLVISLKGKMKKNERVLLLRDSREIIAAVFVMVIFSYKSIIAPSTITMITSALIVVWAGYVIYRLLEVRKYKKAVDLNQSFKSQLLQQKYYIEQQAQLLDNALYWYVGPFALVMTISKIGNAYTGTFDLALLSSISIGLTIIYLFSWFLYVINKKAAKTAYRPIIENIDRVLLQIDEEKLN